MARWAVLGVLAFGAVAVLSACGLVKSYAPFRYRLTVEVDTPAGLRTGSSVMEVSAGEVRSSLGGSRMGLQRGEAVAVDLPGGRTLFALLRSEDDVEWSGGAMGKITPTPNRDAIPLEERFSAHVEAIKANRKLNVLPRYFKKIFDADERAPTGYPMLVRFRDIRDPKTVERVDPDNLAASFGDGVRLRRITVQVTDDDVTVGIEKKVGNDFWNRWGQINQSELAKGNVMDNEYFSSLAGRLSRNDFSTEPAK